MNAPSHTRARAQLLLVVGMSALVALSGCRESSTPAADAGTKVPSAQDVPVDGNPSAPTGGISPPTAEANTVNPPETTADTAHDTTAGGMIKQSCGNAEFSLSVDSVGDEGARRTTLQRHAADGQSMRIAVPEALHDYTAVGLGCAVSPADGKSYLVVQYGQLPEGCAYCEWFHLYDTDGNVLTKNTQAILVDRTQPQGSQEYPDNESYDALLKKLQITHPDIQYVE